MTEANAFLSYYPIHTPVYCVSDLCKLGRTLKLSHCALKRDPPYFISLRQHRFTVRSKITLKAQTAPPSNKVYRYIFSQRVQRSL